MQVTRAVTLARRGAVDDKISSSIAREEGRKETINHFP